MDVCTIKTELLLLYNRDNVCLVAKLKNEYTFAE